MAEIAAAFVSVLPSARGFGTALSSQITPEAARSGDEAGRAAGSRFSGAFGTAIKGGAVLFGGLAVAGATAGLKTAAAMQNADIAFTTMLGSAEKSRAFLDDLAAFAAKTPFEFPELQKAASSLVSAGFEASKVIPIMTTLGDVTSGMGTGAEGVQRATVALQQMSAAGRITGEDLNQLRDAGVPVFDLLSAATGKSKEAIAELANSGKLGREEMEQLFSALETGKGLERFTGLMEKQSQTLSGVWSTLMDSLNMGLADTMMPLVPVLTALLPKAAGILTSALKVLAGWMQNAVDWFQRGSVQGGVLQTAWAKVSAVTSEVVGWFKSLRTEGDGASGIFAGITAAVGPLGDKLKTTVASSGGFSGILDKIKTAISGINWETIGQQIGSLFDSVKTLGPVFQEGFSNLPSITDALSLGTKVLRFFADHVDTVVKLMPLIVAGFVAFKVAQAAANLVSAATPAIRIAEIIVNRQLVASQRAMTTSLSASTLAAKGSIVATEENTVATGAGRLASIRAAAATAFHTVVEKTKAAAAKGWAAAQWLLNAAMSANPIALVVIAVVALAAAFFIAWKKSETFRNIVIGAWNAIKAVVGAVVGWFTTAIPAAWDWVKNTAMTVFGAIASFFTGWWSSISSTFSSALTGIQTVFSGIWNVIFSVIQFYWSAIQIYISTALGIIRGIITTVTALIHGDWSGVWNGIKAIFGAIWTGIKGILSAALGAVTGILSGGLAFIQGLWSTTWNGIKSVTSTVWNGIKTVISGAWDGIKSLISGALTTVKGWISSAWDTVKATTTTAWANIKLAIITKTGELITYVTGIPGRILSALGNVGKLLYDAGKKVIQGLLDGIGSMIGSIGGVMGDVLGKIADFLPGSPVKTGPLRVLNRGYAGSQIGKMLADGMLSQQDLIAKAAGVLAGSAAVDVRGKVQPPSSQELKRIVRMAPRFDSAATRAGAVPAAITLDASSHTYYPVARESPEDIMRNLAKTQLFMANLVGPALVLDPKAG